MRFRFPLQKLLEHRKVVEDVAQRDFQEALSILNQEKDVLSHMQASLRNSYDEAFRLQHRVSGSTSEQLRQIDQFIFGLKIQMSRQESKIQECEKLVESRREILRERAVEYKIIERLRQKKKEEFGQEMAKKEQNDIDELTVLRKPFGKLSGEKL